MRFRDMATVFSTFISLVTVQPVGAVSTALIDLELTSLTAASAHFEVRLTMTGDPGDEIDLYQLSVFGSGLTAGDTDFSRYSFVPADLVTLTDADPDVDWLHSFDVGVDGLTLVETDFFNVAADPIVPRTAPYLLGLLTLDLKNISFGTRVTVTVNGGSFPADTQVFGKIDNNPLTDFGTSGRLFFADPLGVAFTAVPEPISVVLALMSLAACGLSARRRRRAPCSDRVFARNGSGADRP